VHNRNTQNTFFSARHTVIDITEEGNSMSFDDYVNNPIWRILVDTVHTLPMFAHHKAYVRDVVQSTQPQINAEDLALKLGISLGESLVILYELQASRAENKT